MSASDASSPTELPASPPGMVHTIRGIISTVGLVALVVCCSRLYIRKFVTNAIGLDDYLVILALIMVLLFAVLSIIITFYGIGYHMSTVPPDKLETMQYIVYCSLCSYLFVALAVKTSLTVFIMRVFPTKFIRRLGIGMIIFMIVMTISGEFPLIFQCSPVKAAWKSVPNSKCLSSTVLMKLQLYQAILMFLIDCVIIIMPIPTIWRLQMPLQRRLVIIGLFALGFIACAAGLARIPLLGYQTNATDFSCEFCRCFSSHLVAIDLTQKCLSNAGGIPLILMNTEYALGLITGSLPSLRVLFRWIPGLRSSQKQSNEWTSGAAGSAGHELSNKPRWSRKNMPRRLNDTDSVVSESEQRIIPTVK
ncbi:hypothetical protein BDW69DRAFT_191957 [Aspergillus filifer]